MGLLFSLILSAASATPTAPNATVLSWDVKVRPPDLPGGTDSAHLSAARGECQAFQLLIRPPAQRVAVAPPVLAAGSSHITLRLYREAFVRVKKATNSDGAPGLWADPLLPADDAAPAGSSREAPLVYYVEACVPMDQPTGKYLGQAEVTDGSPSVAKIPVTLDVLPFTLPATSTLPTTFGLSLYTVAKGHHLDPASLEAERLLREYKISLLSHRLSPFGLSQRAPDVTLHGDALEVDFRRYDEEMAPFFDGTVLPSGARFTTADLREGPKWLSEEQRVEYYRAFARHFAERGWRAKLFFYAKDEPKPADVPVVLKQSARVRKAGGIAVLITAPLDKTLTPAADLICPIVNCFFPRPGPATCRQPATSSELRAQLPPTTRVWWYQSCMSHGCNGSADRTPAVDRAYTGWPSYVVDAPATLNRAMGPLAFLAGVEGELYWDTTYAYAVQDPWTDLYAFGGNGDGTFFYPGTPARLGTAQHHPVESLRLKLVRAGLQDYEYLQLVAKRDLTLARQSAERLARSGFEINRDTAEWDRVHSALASFLSSPRAPGASTDNNGALPKAPTQ